MLKYFLRFDLDQSTFSPTELDDSFMLYYRHPPTTDASGDSQIIANLHNTIAVAKINSNKQDFSHHPVPCQKYLQAGKGKAEHSWTIVKIAKSRRKPRLGNTESRNVLFLQDVTPPPQTTAQMKIKSHGTDDGFKGEAAKCGSSIIRVASQMVSGKVIHGFSITENEACKNVEAQGRFDERKKRGSISLPASPLTSPNSSPKSNRKITNKYFTGAFTDSDRSKGGWILSNLLAKRETSASVDRIDESKEELDRTHSVSSIDGVVSKKSPVIKAKPSELREMNFWSPTSM